MAGHKVAFINAFEQDYTEDPFLPIAAELSALLDSADGRGEQVKWLEQFEGGVFCVDFHGDWDLLVDLLDGVPGGWGAALVWDAVDKGRLESYFREFGCRHHALYDARALRFAMLGHSITDRKS